MKSKYSRLVSLVIFFIGLNVGATDVVLTGVGIDQGRSDLFTVVSGSRSAAKEKAQVDLINKCTQLNGEIVSEVYELGVSCNEQGSDFLFMHASGCRASVRGTCRYDDSRQLSNSSADVVRIVTTREKFDRRITPEQLERAKKLRYKAGAIDVRVIDEGAIWIVETDWEPLS